MSMFIHATDRTEGPCLLNLDKVLIIFPHEAGGCTLVCDAGNIEILETFPAVRAAVGHLRLEGTPQ